MKRKLWIMLALAMALAALLCGTAMASGHSFTSQPAEGTFDGTALTLRVNWKTDFTPVKVIIRQKSGTDYTNYKVLTSGLAASMGYPFPATALDKTFEVCAYYGSGADDFVRSSDFSLDRSLLKFTSQPVMGNLNGTSLTYTASWKTSFKPLKVVIRRKNNSNDYSVYAAVTGNVAAAMSYPFPASCTGLTFEVCAFFGTGENDMVRSSDFTIPQTGLAFTTQPVSGNVDPETLNYVASWKTGFKPLKILIRKRETYNNYSVYATLASNLSAGMSYPFPCSAAGCTFEVCAFYGTGESDMVRSADFSIDKNTLKFTKHPQSGEVDPATLTCVASWTTSFKPRKVLIRKSTGSNKYSVYATLTSNLSASMSYPFPVSAAGSTFEVCACYGTGEDEMVRSADFSINNSNLVFTQAPTADSLNSTARTYPVRWKTSFTPVKVKIRKRENSNNYSEYITLISGLSASMSYPIPAANAGKTFEICAYYGPDEDDRVRSADFTLDSSQLKFTSQPTVGMLDSAANTIPVSWKTSFRPAKILIRRKNNSDYTNYATLTSGLSTDMGYPFPAGAAGDVFEICAFYGSGSDDMIRSADFSLDTYCGVTFDLQGHGGAIADQVVNFGGKATRPTDPTASGWTFKGWYIDASCTKAFDFNEPVTSSITLYAKWIVGQRTVTFDANGGSVSPASARTGTNGKLASLPTPTREHYRFDYWLIKGTGTVANTSTVFTEDTTLCAQWSSEHHTVTVIDGTVDRSAGGIGQTFQLTADKKTGMKFIGWEILSGSGEIDNPQNPSAQFKISYEDVTIRANFEYIPWTVIFYGNGGYVNPASMRTGTDGKLAYLPTPTRDGYNFTYWRIRGTDRVATADTVYDKVTTLDANWEMVYHTVTVFTGQADRASAGIGETVSISADERENFRFTEWKILQGDVTLEDRYSADTSFKMGLEDVSISARYEYTGEYLTDLYIDVTPPSSGASPEPATIDTDQYRITESKWIDLADGHTLGADEVFEANKTYLLRVYLATNRLPVASAPTGYVNGSADGVTCEGHGIGVAMIEKEFQFIAYTVSFDANGGTGSMDPVVLTQSEYTLPVCEFTPPAQHAFVWWLNYGRPGVIIHLAGDITLSPVWRQTTGACGDDLTWEYTPETGLLTITGTGPMTEYSSYIGVPWYIYHDSITAVVIGDDVESISKTAFFQHSALTSVTLGKSIESIGNNAFAHCGALEYINLPDGLKNIGAYAFYLCKALEEIRLPDTLETLGSCAFQNCYALTDVTVPRRVSSVGRLAFSGCKAMSAATILGVSTQIGEKAFNGCATNFTLWGYPLSAAQAFAAETGLKFEKLAPAPTLLLPAGLTELEDEAFAGIPALAVVIHGNVTRVSGNPFAGSDVQAIYGLPDSAAEDFASSHDINFVPVDEAWLADR